MILKTIKSLIMANKKTKKQSVKSLITNKSAKKSAAKSGGAAKSIKAKADKPSKKPIANAASQAKKADAKIKAKVPPAKVPSKKEEVVEAKKMQKPSKIATETQKDSKPVAVVAKKSKSSKVQKAQKESTEIDDDFLSDDVEAIEDIGEYEEELKAVEEADEDTDDETAWDLENKESGEDEIILTDAEGRRYCRARDCDQISAVDVYCRYHYLLFWKRIQIRKKILTDGKLERYVEELTGRYPDKFLEMIRRDLRTTKDFLSAIQELEIDESASGDNDFEEESQSFIDEVRGLNEAGPTMDEEEY